VQVDKDKENKRFQVFSIKEIVEGPNKDKKTIWVKAGSAWKNRDGSFNVYLDVLPLEGRLHVREALEERRAETNNTNSRNSSANGSSTQPAHAADSMGGH
jgi:hypothetical protein